MAESGSKPKGEALQFWMACYSSALSGTAAAVHASKGGTDAQVLAAAAVKVADAALEATRARWPKGRGTAMFFG
jgi:hypothetical protein